MNPARGLVYRELTQHKPQNRSLFSTRQIGVVALDNSKRCAKDDGAPCEKNAQECQDGPLIGQIANDVGL